MSEKLKIHKAFRPHLSKILQYEKVNFKVSDLTSSGKTAPIRADRFIVKMEYCGLNLSFHVLFNQYFPQVPPDFIIDFDLLEMMDNLKSIEQWDLGNENALLDVFLEIREKYKQIQGRRLEFLDKPKVQFDLSSVEHVPGVEYTVDDDELKLCVPLDEIPYSLVLNDLPSGISDEDMGYLQLILTYNLHGSDFPMRYVKIPDLWRVNDKSGDCASLKNLPAWDPDFLLTEYISEIKATYEEKVLVVKKRRGFVEAVMANCGTPLSYDNINYKSVSFLAETSQYTVLVKIELADTFPERQPKITLQSMIHWGRTKGPKSRIYNDYRYSPRWDSDEMVKRIRSSLKETIPVFAKLCLKG